jgi:hypothetical protein
MANNPPRFMVGFDAGRTAGCSCCTLALVTRVQIHSSIWFCMIFVVSLRTAWTHPEHVRALKQLKKMGMTRRQVQKMVYGKLP